jgi:serine/threonine-protein kinase
VGTTVTDPLVGRLVDGRYEVVSRIARGGMATVYLAVDRRLDREVALKVMHPHLAEGASGSDFVARFRREARTAARLAHPGLVSVFDQGVDGDTSYLTMEYVAGTTLRRRLAEKGALSVADALRIVEQVLDALAAAHRAGLVHRDIKPENVLIDGAGRVKLTDFGLARAVTEVTSTATGTVFGTVAYLAPELVARGVADARTDVYACGILLFEMLTGRQPFTGDTPIQVAFQHVNADIPAPSSLEPWLPSEVDELVEALAAREPADRPIDAGAALSLLRRTRSQLDDETLARHADVAPTVVLPAATEVPTAHDEPDGIFDEDAAPVADEALDRDNHPTTKLDGLRGTTVALPIGTGLSSATPAATTTRRHHRVLATVMALVLLVAVGAGAWWYVNAGPGSYTTVPAMNLGVTTEGDAKTILTSHGLTGMADPEFDDHAPKGTIVSLSPASGAKVPKGGAVTYVVSRGVDLVSVPDGVVGKMQADADTALKAADLKPVYGEPQYDDKAPKGQVLTATVVVDGSAQDATPGMQVKRQSEVTLVVANGPTPTNVPSVVGMTVDAATAQLAQDKLKLNVSDQQFNDQVPAGQVISQDPAANAAAHHGDTVNVVVSKGVEMLPVPNVKGEKVDKATTDLQNAGFQVNVLQSTIGGKHGFNLVYDQIPAGGKNATAPRNAVITIYVF